MTGSTSQVDTAGASVMVRLVVTAFFLGLALGLLGGLVYLLDPWVKFQANWFYLTLLNTAPLLFPLLLVATFFRRIWPAAVVTGYTTWLLFVINSIKLAELEQPLLFTDILLLPQVIGNASMLGLYADPGLLVGVTLGALVLVGLTAWIEPPKGRWIGALSFLCLSGLLGFALISDPVHRILSDRGAMDTPWSPIESVKETGLIASAAASAGRDVVFMPEPDRGVLAETLKRVSSPLMPDGQIVTTAELPDIVMVLSESFFDPDILRGVDACVYLPKWCLLKGSAISGRMSVPTYGGNTTRTEFEVLTGIPYALLPAGVYPYTSVVRKPMASLPHWLKFYGYETTAIHPHKRTFWQRHRAYPLLGFQRFISEEDMSGYSRKGWFISDRDMTDLIIEKLQEGVDRPQFIFAISMENHGPWNKPRPNLDQQRLVEIAVPEMLEQEGALTWRQYIYHAQNAIGELVRLKRFLDARERPSLVVFFGDHLPALSPVYEPLGFDDGLEVLTQQTPFLILGGSLKRGSDWDVESAFQLPMKILEAGGLPQPLRYQVLSKAYETPDHALPAGAQAALQLSLLQERVSEWQKEVIMASDQRRD